MECNITTPADTVLEAQREWLGQREDIMKKYGFMSDSGARAVPSGLTEESVRAMVGEVINAHRKLFSAVRDKVGALTQAPSPSAAINEKSLGWRIK